MGTGKFIIQMRKILFYTILLTCTFSWAQQPLSQGPFDQLIIRGVTLINGTGAPPQGPVDVVVENNIITQVRVVGYPNVPIQPDMAGFMLL